jgi:MFS family permease
VPPPTKREPIGRRSDRMLVILVGVVVGYFVGGMLADRFGWQNAGMITMPVGGLIAGVIGRFALERFRTPNDKSNTNLRRVK